jgi:hypothetical protein
MDWKKFGWWERMNDEKIIEKVMKKYQIPIGTIPEKYFVKEAIVLARQDERERNE